MLPRYSPDRFFPPYTYVPGRAPHPIRDPAGHWHDVARDTPQPLSPTDWADSPDYLWGVDLFNAGFYWEAHEVWEGLWHAAGRAGETADFLKGLIRYAAAGVKHYEGRAEGVTRHRNRAVELLSSVSRRRSTSGRYAGIEIDALVGQIASLRSDAMPAGTPPVAGQLGELRLG
ncbi:MAG: DUF309 domain-containing protein [Planctomycetaceae bacterium]